MIGSPVRHSLSPAIHNAAFAHLGLDWAYLAFEVEEGRATGALAGMRALGVAGLSVTMPHKTAVAAECDDLSATATALRSVNTVVLRDRRLVGESTDGAGFIASLRDAGVEPPGLLVVVLGAGGAARAVVHALGAAGANVRVVARRRDAAEEAAALGGSFCRVGEALDVVHADVVVNATSLGMAGTPGHGQLPVDPHHLLRGQVVVDLVYHPVRTPLLAAAEAAGARVVDGVGMLVHQAAIAFTLWTGCTAPLDVMHRAATTALSAT